MTKRCSHCKTDLDISAFYRSRQNQDGLSSWCKKCSSKMAHSYRVKDPAHTKERERRWRVKNVEKCRASSRKYSSQNHIRARRQERFRFDAKTLGLDTGYVRQFYDETLKAQHGCCAICGRHADTLDCRLVLDHNHTTGKLRGLLCRSCNVGIGNLRDSADLCEKAMDYLSKKE